MARISPPPLKSIVFGRYHNIQGFFKTVAFDHSTETEPPLKVHVNETIMELSSDLLSALPLDKVETFGLFHYTAWSLLPAVSLLPHLHTICINRFGGDDFYLYVAADPAIQHQNPRKPFTKTPITLDTVTGSLPPTTLTRFPSLTTLICRNVDFMNVIPLSDFKELLMLRAEKGRPLRSLHLEKCVRLDRQDIDELADIVDNVEWDGEFIDTYSDEESQGPECGDCGTSGCEHCDF
ncbi:hypothetical protein CC2G_009931 [Coprinopsis cinerea AmutBmut pab1-1]|nr:hypothetical protein CC2G_009931 [Coprinopsis cinerea AmutBmut pab1-1]